MNLTAFGIRKPVVVNLAMFAIIGAGIIFGLGLRREFFPEVRPNLVLISAPYPGASPEEVEKSLAIKIEDAIANNLDDIKEINTTVGEGFCTVLVEFEEGVDVAKAVFDVKTRMDALQDLPPESDRIVVDSFEPNIPTINVTLYGDSDERLLKDAILQIREDLRRLPDMGDIILSGVRSDEISVEVDPAAMLEHGLSLPEISGRLRQALVELPGGAVRGRGANVSVRTMGFDDHAEAIRGIVVKAEGGGQALLLRDVARVSEGFEDVDLISRLNGKPAASLTVFKVGKKDAVEMAEKVKAYVAGHRGEAFEMTVRERLSGMLRPPNEKDQPVSERHEAYLLGLSRANQPLPGTLTTTTDLSRFITGRLELLARNAFQGGILVLLTLVLLLNWRVAFWVATGLIISLLGTLVMMRLAGISLNLLTMFGMLIVIGLLVDDAIVVAENIVARHEKGEPALDAAVNGTAQVKWPVIVTVLTTISAFMPLALIEGTIGDLLSALPAVVACALAVSLFECLFILPSHLGHSLLKVDEAHDRKKGTWFGRLEGRMDRARDAFVHGRLIPAYGRMLEMALKARYFTMACVLSVLVISFGMVGGGHVPFNFISSSDAETVNISLQMPVGTPIEGTEAIVRRIEAVSIAQPEITAVFSSIGSSGSLDGSESSRSTHLGQLILELVPIENRDRSSEEVILAIRDELGPLPGVKSLRMEEIGGGPEGPSITLALSGDNAGVLRRVADEIQELLGEFDGVYDISDNDDLGRRELRIRLRPGADELGFTVENLALQVRGAFFGLEAHTFAGNEEDVDVRVMLPEEERRSLTALEEMYVFTPGGEAVPLGEVASIEEGEGYATLRRLNRERIITVTAEVNDTVTRTEAVMGALRPRLSELMSKYPEVNLLERGRQEDVQDSFSTLPLGLAVAVGLIYVLLAWLFQSYLQPLVVLTAVPFAIIGVIWGHFLLGFDMTILSLIGFIALSGVVVNDSLILMEFYNEKRAEGRDIFDACVSAGRARLRAILLTTITTVLGLLPLLLEQSFQARFLIPMAITITGGLISATVVILVAIPCFLMIGNDISRVAGWLWRGGVPKDASVGGV